MRVYNRMAQTRVQYLAKLFAFKYTQVARCPEIIFRDTGTFSYFLLCPCSSVILNDVTFNTARAPREGLNKDKGAGYSTTIGKEGNGELIL